MEENTRLLESFLQSAEEYTKTTVELVKLKSVDKVSDVASSVASRSIALVFFILFFTMGSVGLALWLGELLGKPFYGFLVLAGFFGVIWLVLYFVLHDWIKRVIGNSIIEQLLK